MTPKDILAVVACAEEEATFAAADALSKRWSASVFSLQLVQTPDALVSAAPFAVTAWAQILEASRARADAEAVKIAARLKKFAAPTVARRAEAMIGPLGQCVAAAGRHCDLTIVQHGDGPLAQAVLEAALFNTGRPTLLMPRDWRGGAIGAHVMVAWSATREAARALADAAPFLEGADGVTVVAVDPSPVYEGDTDLGLDIKAHLSRHGVVATLRQPGRAAHSVEEVLLDEARKLDADLIVMGGYGHSRMREFVLSGVTRALTRAAPIPILLSH